MARTSSICKNNWLKKLVERYKGKRAELASKIKDENLSDEERYLARIKLQKLPRNSSPVRVRNRCEITGRPRGYLSKFRMSRISFRELSLRGMIPGVTKSSW